MVVGLERLEYFIEALEKKSPEVMKWPKVARKSRNMCSIVVVRFYNVRTIKLDIECKLGGIP